MSNVICEICGTAYSSADAKCPVCGFEKPVTADFADACARTAPVSVRENSRPSKGGRYTKANVAKRMSEKGKPSRPSKNSKARPKSKPRKKKRKQSGGGLVALIVLLLIAIVLVGGYLLLKYFRPDLLSGQGTQPQQNTSEQTDPPESTDGQTDSPETAPSTVETQPDLSCTELKLSENSIRFNKPGNAWLLNVIPNPANTTDTITFHSEDESVATVDAYGRVVAVGAGETVIVITCGDVSIECKVSCKEGPAPTTPEDTKPEETQPEETTKPVDMSQFKLNRKDFSLAVGESWQLYNGSIDPADITWASSNTGVATVNNGKVTGVGKGQAMITAEYNGVKLECVVYVGY